MSQQAEQLPSKKDKQPKQTQIFCIKCEKNINLPGLPESCLQIVKTLKINLQILHRLTVFPKANDLSFHLTIWDSSEVIFIRQSYE
jgi:hypothetical protein